MPVFDAELARIDLEIERIRLALASLHIAADGDSLRVGPRDSLRVAHLKERLIRLQRERRRALFACGGSAAGAASGRGAIH